MRSIDFFETHPVFTHREFAEAGAADGRSLATSNNLLSRHLAAGRLIRVRRGLYATVQRGVDPNLATVDPYLVATKLAGDAAVSHHAALQFHGKAYSIWHRVSYLTRKRSRGFSFRGYVFQPVQAPAALRALPDLGGGISKSNHGGGLVRVTSLERTMVDCLHAPDVAGGWEEIWRSLEMVEFFDLDQVIDFAIKLDSAVTAARVGFFLEQHRDELMVEPAHLDSLRPGAPTQARYLDTSRRPGKLIRGWNLIVPEDVLNRSWEEVI